MRRLAPWLALGLLATPGSAGAAVEIGHLPPEGAAVADSCGGNGTFLQHLGAGRPSYAVPEGGGLLTSWTYRAGSTAAVTVKLKVLRKMAGTGMNYTTVGEHGFFTATPDEDNLFKVGPPAIPVQAGDLPGLRLGTVSAACVWTTDWSEDEVFVSGGDAPVGGFNTYFPAALDGRRVNIRATIEQDADGDLRGDDTQDTDDDNDGVADTADNCAGTPAGDTADLDADGQGDACDADDDGDGLPDAAETAFGTNPRATDTDGDGRADGLDACPLLAASSSNGCPAGTDTAAPGVVLTGFAKRLRRVRLLRRGLAGRVVVSEPADVTLRLLGRLRGARVARAGDVVLAERRLTAASGTRAVRLKIPRRLRPGLARRLRLTLVAEAADAAGNRASARRRVRVR